MLSLLQSKFANRFGKDSRTLNIGVNSLLMFIIKCLSFLLSFISVPILIGSLDKTSYGIWLTLTSIVSWLSFCDVGLGHGVRNRIAEALARNDFDSVKYYVSSGYFVLLLISLTLILLTLLVGPLINWSAALGASQSMNRELTYLACFVISLFLLNLSLKLIDSIFYAFQRPALGAVLSFLIQFFSVLSIYVMSKSGREFTLLHYGIILSGIPNIVTIIFTCCAFRLKYRKFVPSIHFVVRKYCNDIVLKGSQFFLVQITAIALFQTNNFVIAQCVNPAAVTDFNIAYKYYGIVGVIFSILVAPLWSAATDAFHSKDYNWIFCTLKSLEKLYIFAIISLLFMFAISPFIYRFWLENMIVVNWEISILVLIYQVLSIRTGIYCAFLNGIGKIRLQFYFTFGEAILHIPLAILLGNILGVAGVLISMCLMTFINNIWEPMQLKKILTDKAYGVWGK